MRAYIAAAGILAAMPLFAAIQDTHQIKWNPKVGEKSKYKMEVDGSMDVPGMGATNMHFELLVQESIKEITGDKVVVGGQMLDMKIMFGDQDISEMAGATSEEARKEYTTTYNLKRQVLSSNATAEMRNPRFERMSEFSYPDKPLAVDESWTVEMKADKSQNLPPARSKYTFKGLEELNGKKYYRIEYAFSELEGAKPMGAMGVMHMEPETGRAFRIKADVNDVQFDEQMPPMNVKFSMQLQ